MQTVSHWSVFQRIFVLLFVCIVAPIAFSAEEAAEEPNEHIVIGLPTDILNFDMLERSLSTEPNMEASAVTPQAKYIELVWKAWAEKNNLSLTFKWGTNQQLVDMMEDDKIDILGLGDEIEEMPVLYSTIPYVEIQAKIYERVIHQSVANEAAAFHLSINLSPVDTNETYSILFKSSDAELIASYADKLSYIYSVRWWAMEAA
ncbi:hypothetical protein RCJ22_21160 [Vibrio sp. FNV 38]|nr:hypothetical protein [Vibrio sp. FNV 38]